MIWRIALILMLVSPPVRVLAGLCCMPADLSAAAVADESGGCCASEKPASDEASCCGPEPVTSCCAATDEASASPASEEPAGCGLHSVPGRCCDKCPCCVPAPPVVLRELQKPQVRPPSYPLTLATVDAGPKVGVFTFSSERLREREHPPDHGTRQAQLAVWLD